VRKQLSSPIPELGLICGIQFRQEMCTIKYIKYTCGCKKEMEFVQCPDRQGTNVKCSRSSWELGKTSTNYCSKHLVKPDAAVKYTDQNGPIAEE
jgi:hypothetical protein